MNEYAVSQNEVFSFIIVELALCTTVKEAEMLLRMARNLLTGEQREIAETRFNRFMEKSNA